MYVLSVVLGLIEIKMLSGSYYILKVGVFD